MDVLWSKERLHKIFSKDSISLNVRHASGDGGSAFRCCRLCGGEGTLRCFCETYLWEGVEERYDQLLFNCFGVRPLPADGLICERCVCQLRNTQRFRALVQSAFARPPSDYSTNQSQLGISEGYARKKTKSKSKLSRLELAKKSTRTGIDLNLRKNIAERKKSIFNTNVQPRRVNLACTVCQHKYPMIMPYNGCKNFICSRCKKKGELQASWRKFPNLPTNLLRNNLELNARTDLRGRSRLFSVQKTPSQSVKIPVPSKYQCKQCPKKYAVAQHLTQHIDTVHKNTYYNTVCKICEKEFNTKELLDRHMRMHTGQPVYQCDVCMRVFKGKRAFQTHYLTHGK